LIEPGNFKKDVTVISHKNTSVDIPFIVTGDVNQKVSMAVKLFNDDIVLEKELTIIVEDN
jgi:hypothetical protein